MVVELIPHLARRAIVTGSEAMKNPPVWIQSDRSPPAQDPFQNFKSPGAIVALSMTSLAYTILGLAFVYIYQVINTLTIIEDTGPNGAIRLPNDDEAALNAPLVDEYDLPSKPVTSGLRSTYKHLGTVGGFRGKFRGILHGAFYLFIYSTFFVIFSAALAWIPFVGLLLASIATACITCNLRASWTHAMMGTPSEKPFFKQYLTRQQAKKLLLPAARYHIALYAPLALFAGSTSIIKKIIDSRGPSIGLAFLASVPLILMILAMLFVVFPSHIALVRCEASLLQEDRNAIVSFDRTFGGRINWLELTTMKSQLSKMLRIKGAYQTFDKATYIRCLKMMFKLTTLWFMVATLFGIVYAIEIIAFGGFHKRA